VLIIKRLVVAGAKQDEVGVLVAVVVDLLTTD
jgi:hypothetical protein